MKTKIIILTVVLSICSILANAQYDFSDSKYDSTRLYKNAENKTHQIDYYRKRNLVMQKFYPDGQSIGGFCYGTNLVYDSILVHLGSTNSVAKFSRGGKSVTIYSWKINGNIINIDTYDRAGNITLSQQELKVPEVNSAYPLCWYQTYLIGVEKKRNVDSLMITTNYDDGIKYTNNFQDTVVIDTVFLKLKERAFFFLEASYSTAILSQNMKFNLMRSCFYAIPMGKLLSNKTATS
ncbi:MAG: hypothetical protein IPG07_06155 [Crocinitomicaceae bacterium]|nr:hypothetical protein [Crocinitomicaceae bacterium]